MTALEVLGFGFWDHGFRGISRGMVDLVRLGSNGVIKGGEEHPHAVRRLQVPVVSVATWR